MQCVTVAVAGSSSDECVSNTLSEITRNSLPYDDNEHENTGSN
jgi:hypothetical protein